MPGVTWLGVGEFHWGRHTASAWQWFSEKLRDSFGGCNARNTHMGSRVSGFAILVFNHFFIALPSILLTAFPATLVDKEYG